MYQLTQRSLNDLTYQIIGAAIEVHKSIGPGLLEQVYESCLAYELKQRGLKVVGQQSVPISYKGVFMEANLRYDLLVEDTIVLELKAAECILPIFEARLITFMHLLRKPKGILLNFCCSNIYKEGQKTFINDIFRDLPKG